MVLRIGQIKKGDEFIISSNGDFRYYKALEDPKINPKNKYGHYSGLKCSTNKVETTIPHPHANHVGSYYFGKTVTTRIYHATAEGHNVVERVNLNWRKMWLVRRETINN